MHPWKNIQIFCFTPSQSNLKYGSEIRPWVRGLRDIHANKNTIFSQWLPFYSWNLTKNSLVKKVSKDNRYPYHTCCRRCTQMTWTMTKSVTCTAAKVYRVKYQDQHPMLSYPHSLPISLLCLLFPLIRKIHILLFVASGVPQRPFNDLECFLLELQVITAWQCSERIHGIRLR